MSLRTALTLVYRLQRCHQTRSLFVEKSTEFITWPCQIKTFFSQQTWAAGLGLPPRWIGFERRRRALFWRTTLLRPAFSPSPGLLERYRHDERVGGAANNHQRLPSDSSSYRFRPIAIAGVGLAGVGLGVVTTLLKGLAGFSRWSMARATGGEPWCSAGPMVGAARGWADRHLGWSGNSAAGSRFSVILR